MKTQSGSVYNVGLPWYDLEEISYSTDRFWALLRSHLIQQDFDDQQLPSQLNRSDAFLDQWLSKNLLISQACGYDLITGASNKLQIIGTPSFSVDGLPPGSYFSYLITSEKNTSDQISDFKGKTVVINSKQSYSGMGALVEVITSEFNDVNIFDKVLISGSHEKSIELVSTGCADLASIDCITFNIILRHAPKKLKGLRIFTQTKNASSPPYVTAQNCSPGMLNRLQKAFKNCFKDELSQPILESLFLNGITFPGIEAYTPMLNKRKQDVQFLKHGLGDLYKPEENS